MDQRIKTCRFEMACDVTNSLTGILGARLRCSGRKNGIRRR
ncbi:MAG: hypothetical protein ACSLEN_14795 [Candidatus Malihini olakiniferum]